VHSGQGQDWMMTQSFHIRKSSENIPRLVYSGLQVQTNWSHILGFQLDPMYMDMARNTVYELIKGTLISGHSLRGYIQFSLGPLLYSERVWGKRKERARCTHGRAISKIGPFLLARW